jgi:hypothetical protein
MIHAPQKHKHFERTRFIADAVAITLEIPSREVIEQPLSYRATARFIVSTIDFLLGGPPRITHIHLCPVDAMSDSLSTCSLVSSPWM